MRKVCISFSFRPVNNLRSASWIVRCRDYKPLRISNKYSELEAAQLFLDYHKLNWEIDRDHTLDDTTTIVTLK